ncbi:MAG: GAF domain-containing protein [Sporichthya sp.]|nr:GAF domain-containing protein [Sporichthya sp.]
MSPDGSADLRDALTRLHPDDLLGELRVRLDSVTDSRDRVHRLLEAVLAVGSDLNLEAVLHRIVEVAMHLADATYGALGVVDGQGGLSAFITIGIDEQTRAEIGALPQGKGLLGELINYPAALRLTSIAEHPASSGFPPNHPPMRSFLGVPVRVRNEVWGNLYLTERRDGRSFDAEDERIVVALAAAAGVAISNARLYAEGLRREQLLSATSQTIRSLLSGATSDDVLRLVADLAKDIAGTDLVAVLLPRTDGSLRVELAVGDGAEQLYGAEAPAGASLAHLAFQTGLPAITEGLADDPRSSGEWTQRLPGGAYLATPMGAPGAVWGVLGLWRHEGSPPFPPETVEVIVSFALQAAVALELAERRNDAVRLDALEDREEIARDLHDLVIQRLFATGMALEGAVRLVNNPDVSERIVRAVDSLDETIKDIRSAIFALHSRAPGANGPMLRGRILAEVQSSAEMLGFTPTLRMEGLLDTRVPEDHADQLVAALREALTNVARHAQAKRVEVSVGVNGDVVLLVVDDGVGLPVDRRDSGLRNLAERARLLGGALLLESGRDGGTRVRWSAPLAR